MNGQISFLFIQVNMHLDKCYSKATLNEKENVKNVELPKKEKLFTCCGGLRENLF